MTDDMMTKDGTNPWTLLFETYPKMARMFKATLDEDREVCREIIKTLEDSGRNISAIIVTAQFGFVCPDILHHFKAAIIAVSPSGHFEWTKLLGNPDNPAYMPEKFLPMLEPLSLKERLISSAVHFFLDYDLHLWVWEDTRLGENTKQGRHRWLGGLFTRGHNSCCC